MSTSATVIMVIAAISIWGGLIVSAIHLTKNPDVDINQIPED